MGPNLTRQFRKETLITALVGAVVIVAALAVVRTSLRSSRLQDGTRSERRNGEGNTVASPRGAPASGALSALEGQSGMTGRERSSESPTTVMKTPAIPEKGTVEGTSATSGTTAGAVGKTEARNPFRLIGQTPPPPGNLSAGGAATTASTELSSSSKPSDTTQSSETDTNEESRDQDIVDGVVMNEEGNPVEGAMVTAVTAGTTQQQLTDPNGGFRITGVPGGGVVALLKVSHADYQQETRHDVTMLDGLQVFRLKRSNDLILAVTWSLDSTPVTYYAYRLLRKAETGLYVDSERQRARVEAADGRAQLSRIEAGAWRVEVTVLSPEGEPSSIRGSADFTVSAGQRGLVVPVSIDGGRIIRGTVVLNHANGEPVEGAQLQFVPPSAGFGRFPTVKQPFQLGSVASNPDGTFAFEGMPPGRYTLSAKKENLVAPQAVDVVVPYESDPNPVGIVMMQGGVIHGQVLGMDGSPLVGAAVSLAEQRVNADGWIPRNAETDVQGQFRIEGLLAGAHWLHVTGALGQEDSRFVDLRAGEEREVNIDFSGAVEVYGRITVNGAAPGGAVSGVMFVGESDSRSESVQVDSNGTYHVRVQPNSYVLSFPGSMGVKGTTDPFPVLPEPDPQERNFDLSVVTANVMLVFPIEGQFEPGQATLSPRNRGNRYNFIRVDMFQEAKQVVSLLSGEYQATFTSRNGEWRGQTDWVRLGPAESNDLVIDVRPTKVGARIGGWKPGDLPIDVPRVLSFDVTPLIHSPASLEVLFQYETGRHAVETYSAAIFQVGELMSRDDHPGWSGSDKFANAYHLTLPSYIPRAEYTLEVRLRCDGGQDSTGSIYITVVATQPPDGGGAAPNP